MKALRRAVTDSAKGPSEGREGGSRPGREARAVAEEASLGQTFWPPASGHAAGFSLYLFATCPDATSRTVPSDIDGSSRGLLPQTPEFAFLRLLQRLRLT